MKFKKSPNYIFGVCYGLHNTRNCLRRRENYAGRGKVREERLDTMMLDDDSTAGEECASGIEDDVDLDREADVHFI